MSDRDSHSRFVKPLFISLVSFGTLLTVVALFTPAWKIYYDKAGNWNPTIPIYASTTILDGLITSNCGTNIAVGHCLDQPQWEASVMGMVIVALLIEVLVLIWSFMSYSPTCRRFHFYPVPVLTLAAAGLLVVAVSIYGVNYSYYSGGEPQFSFNYPLNPEQIYNPASANMGILGVFSQVSLGYSYWMAVVAAVVMIVATFLACATAATSAK